MPDPTLRRGSIPAPVRAALFGALLGLVTFAVSAWMWRSGATQAAALTPDATLPLGVGCIALITGLGRPAPLPRARGPIHRALPQTPWPRAGASLSLPA